MQWLEYFHGRLQFHGRNAASLLCVDGGIRLLVKSLPIGVEAETTHVYDARLFLEEGLGLRDGDLVRIEGHVVHGVRGEVIHVINAQRA